MDMRTRKGAVQALNQAIEKAIVKDPQLDIHTFAIRFGCKPGRVSKIAKQLGIKLARREEEA